MLERFRQFWTNVFKPVADLLISKLVRVIQSRRIPEIGNFIVQASMAF